MLLLLGFVALGLGWLLPGHYPPWATFEQQAMAAVGASLIGASALVTSKSKALAFPRLAWLPLLGVAVVGLQFAFGQLRFLSDALLAGLYLLAFSLGIVAGCQLVKAGRDDFIDALFGVVAVAAIVSTALALLQWLGFGLGVFLIDVPKDGRPFANLAQTNHLASLLGLGMMALLYFHERRLLRGWVLALAAAWLGFGMLMTQSRTGWLFVGLLAVWCVAMRRRAGLRLSAAATMAGAGVFAAGVWLWPPLNRFLLLAPDTLALRGVESLRWTYWPTLWDAMWRSPWAGYGWTQIGLAQQAAVADHPPNGEWLANSHNLVLDLLLWNGIPLGLLFIALLCLWFVRQVRVCRSPLQWTLLGSVGAVFLHAMLEFPLDFTYFLLPLALMMGALEALDLDAKHVRLPAAGFALPFAVSVAMLAWVGIEYLEVQETSRRLRLVMARIGVDKVSTAPLPEVVLLDAPREFHRFWLTPAKPGMDTQQLDWMREVSERFAIPPAMLRYALAAGLNGRPDDAAVALTRICRMHVPARCDEARQSWAELQRRHAVLLRVPVPESPS